MSVHPYAPNGVQTPWDSEPPQPPLQPPQRAEKPQRVKPLARIDPVRWQGRPVPERRWLVPGLIPHGTVTMLGGDGGLGKSLLGMQLTTACATGKRWLGRHVERCRALSVHCEDTEEELHYRQSQINAHLGIDFEVLEDLMLVSRVGDDNLLMNVDKYGKSTGKGTVLLDQITKAARDFGATLILLDSLHDLFGGNENSRPDARSFINLLRGLALEIGGTIVLLSHPSVAGMQSGSGTSGSTAWNAAVRSRMYLTRPRDEADPDLRELRVMKSNYGALGQPLSIRWYDGVFIPLDEPTGVIATIERRKAERVFLELLDRTRAAGLNVSVSVRSGNYAPKIFACRPDTEGVNRSAFEKAMSSLFAEGQIINEKYGRPHDERSRIARKP